MAYGGTAVALIGVTAVLAGSAVHGAAAEGWVHPAGTIDVATLDEVRRRRDALPWAAEALSSLDRGVQPWLAQPAERLEELLPRRKMQVYWLLICPECRGRMPFEPFNDETATCAACGRTFPLSEQSIAAPPGSAYAGTLYEGWGCHYLLAISRTAQNLALLHALGADNSYAQRAAEILRIFARHIGPLPVHGAAHRMIWTYAYEGDMTVLEPLITAYELLRSVDGLLSPEDHRAIREDLIRHWTDSVLRFQEDAAQRHNNTYRWLTTVALAGCALEDADYVDWAFGVRRYSPEQRPEHRSLAWLADHNYLDDGAFWELCSAYHLYALGPHCEAMVFGRRLSRQMPGLFPPELFDELDPANPRGQVARKAIKWFTSQCFPDLTMAPFGDMGGRVGLDTYPLTAEIGYRYLGIEEVGSYRAIREGERGLTGLLYGPDSIEEQPWPYESAHLSSGYVALKREAGDGNRLYAGLNALLPGGGHQHADRLNLITYSRDRMLSGEKRTRYDDPDQRTYSGASYAHNTVTVDETSQVHGNSLEGARIPHLETFVDLPVVQIAEARGDRVYEQTSIYRRLLCQFDEYLVDIFRVEGGTMHDWFFHGVGERPEVSTPLEERDAFEPALYVVRGRPQYRTGVTDESFSATWRIPAQPDADLPGRRRDVSSRVTVAGFPAQVVNVLSTYPYPAEHSLMVRHAGTGDPFIAVHEAFVETSVVAGVRALPGTSDAAVEVTHADGARRVVVYGSGSAGDDASLRGDVGVLEFGPGGRLRGLALARGRELRWAGERLLRSRDDACVSLSFDGGEVTAMSSPPIAWHTLGGGRILAPGGQARVQVHIPAALSPTGAAWEAAIDLPGQDDRAAPG